MATIWTVGHGARSFEDFLAVLHSASIELLVDVRRFPGSRRHPHFGRDALEASLRENEVSYDWRGEELGGRRKASAQSRHPAWRNDSFRAYADHMDTAVFRDALRRLEEEAGGPLRLAVMCSETLWWRCHRRLIADAMTVDGHEAIHLIAPESHQPHKLHEALRVDPDGRPVYDVGIGAELPFTEGPSGW